VARWSHACFRCRWQQYGEPGSLEDGGNEERLTLNGVIQSGVNRFTYTYDFGDDWEHDILIEKAPPRTDATAFPACVAGKRNCPAGGLRRTLGLLRPA